MIQQSQSWVYIWKDKITNSKRHMDSNFHSSPIYNSQNTETTKVSINRQLAEEDAYIYIHNGISLSHKKNEILPFPGAWMNPENILLSEMSWTEKDKYYMIFLICEI